MQNKERGQVSAVINMTIHGLFAYMFYQYSFNNPDTGSCWAIKTNQTPSSVQLPGYKNVTAQFSNWFMCGFLLNIVGMGI